MKIARLLLPLFIVAHSALLRADEPARPPVPAPAESPPAKLSPELSRQLSSVLPKYAPPATPAARPATPDPDMIELPKVTVTQKKRPRLNLPDEVMMTSKGFNEKLARENLSSFDRNFLNKFSLPAWFSGQSAEARAREDYRLKKNDELAKDVLDLAKVTEVVDPAQAKAMRDAISKP
jgi:hypothetical protein